MWGGYPPVPCWDYKTSHKNHEGHGQPKSCLAGPWTVLMALRRVLRSYVVVGIRDDAAKTCVGVRVEWLPGSVRVLDGTGHRVARVGKRKSFLSAAPGSGAPVDQWPAQPMTCWAEQDEHDGEHPPVAREEMGTTCPDESDFGCLTRVLGSLRRGVVALPGMLPAPRVAGWRGSAAARGASMDGFAAKPILNPAGISAPACHQLCVDADQAAAEILNRPLGTAI